MTKSTQPLRVGFIGRAGYGGTYVQTLGERGDEIAGANAGANWTTPRICAHESAMNGGEEVLIPNFA